METQVDGAPAFSAREGAPVSRAPITLPRDGRASLRGVDPVMTLRFVRAQEGEEGVQRVLSRLAPDDVARLVGDARRGPVAVQRWYPFSLHARLLQAVDEEIGAGDLTVLWELGQFMGDVLVPSLLKPFARLGRPGWLFAVSTRVWRLFHSEGRWVIVRGPRELIARLEDHPEASEHYCAAMSGFVERTLYLSGARLVDGEHAMCRARGAQNCVFTVHWR